MRNLEEKQKALAKSLKAELAGDGSIFGRMSAAPGAKSLPQWFERTVKMLQENNATPEMVDKYVSHLDENYFRNLEINE